MKTPFFAFSHRGDQSRKRAGEELTYSKYSSTPAPEQAPAPHSLGSRSWWTCGFSGWGGVRGCISSWNSCLQCNLYSMPRNNTNCLDVKPLGNGICSGAVVNFCSFYGPLTTRFLHVLSAEYVHFIPYHKMSHSFIINSYYRLKLLNGH